MLSSWSLNLPSRAKATTRVEVIVWLLVILKLFNYNFLLKFYWLVMFVALWFQIVSALSRWFDTCGADWSCNDCDFGCWHWLFIGTTSCFSLVRQWPRTQTSKRSVFVTLCSADWLSPLLHKISIRNLKTSPAITWPLQQASGKAIEGGLLAPVYCLAGAGSFACAHPKANTDVTVLLLLLLSLVLFPWIDLCAIEWVNSNWCSLLAKTIVGAGPVLSVI